MYDAGEKKNDFVCNEDGYCKLNTKGNGEDRANDDLNDMFKCATKKCHSPLENLIYHENGNEKVCITKLCKEKKKK